MTRLALLALAVLGLYAAPALAKAKGTPLPEPFAVAVAPADDGIPKAATPAVPSAESQATSRVQPQAKPEAPEPGESKRGYALKIKPFGWKIGLIGR